MELVIIETDKEGNIEDDLIQIVEILQQRFGLKRITTSPALVITTDIPEAAKLFQAYKNVQVTQSAVAGQSPSGKHAQKDIYEASPRLKKYACLECGKPVGRPNSRCSKHGALYAAQQRKLNASKAPQA